MPKPSVRPLKPGSSPVRVAVASDRMDWHVRFQEALLAQQANGMPVVSEVVDLERQWNPRGRH